MGRSKRMEASYLCLMVAIFVCTLSTTPADCGRSIQEISEQKNYYVPSTPHHSSSPKHSSPKSPDCPTPSNGGSSGGGHSTPTTPSHGSGSGHYYAPPTYGGAPPSTTPGTTVPSPPYSTPGTTEPSPPYSTPGTTVPSPPYSSPAITVPSPPAAYDPNVPPFHPGTCSYWTAHPEKIVVVIGKFHTTVGDFFGVACVFAYGKNPTIHDAVANTNTGGVGALLREGTTALLNSLACKSFPLTQQQVTSAFAAALGTDGSAAAQAEVFKVANEGKYKS